MKKTVLIMAFLLLILSGCGSAKVEKACIASDAVCLSQEDAEEVFEFFRKTVKSGTETLSNDDKLIGGSTISIVIETSDKKTHHYAFLLNNLYYFNDGTTREYKIKNEYLENEFHPFISKLCDKYFPLAYQLTNITQQTVIYTLVDGNRNEVEDSDVFFELGYYVAYYYHESELYDGDLSQARYVLVVEDPAVVEKLYVFDGFAVINSRKIPLPEAMEIDTLFAQN